MATNNVPDPDLEAARRYMARIGAKGGSVTGDSKKRGDAEYYRRIRAKKAEKKDSAQAASVVRSTQAGSVPVKK